MVFSEFLNIVLIVSLVLIVFGLGFMGGLPAWYKNIRENRSNCEDIKYANDASKWHPQKGEPKKNLDKRIWDLTKTLQGNDPRFSTNLAAKAAECAR